ncbi:MAG TPA: hypothetical protein VED20_16580 [Streptosporangiaceae bacterium]|nr:hypothetical protein [Streptosporangiaceae bacterium]
MDHSGRHVHQAARADPRDLISHQEVELTFKDVEQLFMNPVDVGLWTTEPRLSRELRYIMVAWFVFAPYLENDSGSGKRKPFPFTWQQNSAV